MWGRDVFLFALCLGFSERERECVCMCGVLNEFVRVSVCEYV